MTVLPPDMETDLRRENARLQSELNIARDRQNASAEILRTIGNTSGDAEQSLQQIAEITARLFDAPSVTFRLAEGREWGKSINFGASSYHVRDAIPAEQRRLDGDNLPGTVYRENRQVHIPDLDNVDPAMAHWPVMAARAEGTRTVAGTPLRRQGNAIGALLVYRDGLAPFTEEELALQQSFADQAVIAIENTRLFNETKEALERQTATADILKVIASSPSDVQPVFDAIVINAARLVDAFSAGVFRFVDGIAHAAAFTSTNPAGDQALRDSFPRPIADFEVFRRAHSGEGVAIADTDDQPDQSLTELARARGFRSVLHAPLMNKEASIGVIVVSRRNPGPFSAHQVQLLQTFADQAVIAIENTRLFNEVLAKTSDLSESLEQQTATSEVLEIISSSAGELEPIFQKMLENATRICGANFGTMSLYDGDRFRNVALHRVPPAFAGSPQSFRPHPESGMGRAARTRQVVQVADIRAQAAYLEGDPAVTSMADLAGARTIVNVPMLRDGELIGAISIYRQEVRPFTDKQIDLLANFARQVVIAIENARLLKELRERTGDLTEALQFQTATSDVLKVISSSPDSLQPVLDVIVDTSRHLCGTETSTIFLLSGEKFHIAAASGTMPEYLEFLRNNPIAIDQPGSSTARAAREKRTVHIPDIGADPEFGQGPMAVGQRRALLSVPLVHESTAIGVITMRQSHLTPFTERQIEVVQTFADQAVIALSNVRLFEEVQARTRDLQETLQQQTATADVLKVISRSAFDLDSVLGTLVTSAATLCDAEKGVIFLRENDFFRMVCNYGFSPEFETFARANPLPAGSNSTTARAAASGAVVQAADVLADETQSDLAREYQRLGGHRTNLGVPLRSKGETIGIFTLTRQTVRPFNERQVELVQTFADQAVIAIENVRLFDEVQARTEDLRESLQFQTATSEVLKVISRSPDSLQPVLDVIVETSRELCSSDASTIFLLRDGRFHVTAVAGTVPGHLAYMQANPVLIDQPGSVLPRMARDKRTIHVPNVADDPDLSQGSSGVGGPRALLATPLIRDGRVLGGIILRQSHLKPFTPRQIEAIEVFADQAVIAISNVGLFEQVQERTRELSQSLDDLRTAQDRLVQTEKLASLGQLTAGIAHEIKNPLNFVNNFSALSAELTGELNDVLKSAALSDKIRREVDELTGMLKDNLEKVVQHGKRADSIVKNMLLHSREGSGEHRPADINALLDESLNLAYHGARAEKSEFNITLQRNFDEAAGTIEVFPQEITRVFLNLISNGFYAATKRRMENGGTAFDPILSATTINCGDNVEIRIRDNGTGIPTEVKEKMFNPFFTTKPAGEGTGLGLSMSHDIIVKQHGGTIDVETEPGEFTEFRIVLPRTSNISNKNIKQN